MSTVQEPQNIVEYKPFDYVTLAAAIVALIVVSMGIGMSTSPDGWFAELAKPPFNPPNWIFAPVWTILYALIAFAGWRTFKREAGGLSMKIWGAQLLFNWAWSFVFFTFHMIWPALIVISSVAALIVWFMASSWRSDKWAALAMAPYLAWVSFATVLNLSIGILN